jgi:ABC-type uncharacterized transport system substrate-binding protein
VHPHIPIFIECKWNVTEENKILEEFGEVLEIKI